MSDWPILYQYGLLGIVGVVVAFINSLSGGGSMLSLPLLMFLGLSPVEANGTNRLGIWAGSFGSVLGFRKQQVVTQAMVWNVGWPGLLGSLAGSYLGVFTPAPVFKLILAIVIVFIVWETVRGSRRSENEILSDVKPYLLNGIIPFFVYIGIGFYGGFIQAGSGLIMIYAFSRLSNLNLIHINELKVANTFIFITVSLSVYLFFGKVKLGFAIALAMGNLLGGYLGSGFQIQKGEGFVRGFLLVTGLVFAGKLAFDAIFAFF